MVEQRHPPLAPVPDEYLAAFFDGDRSKARVVFFDPHVDRFTSLHRTVRRVLMISMLGTVYICEPGGDVTHSMPLADERRHVHVEVDEAPVEGRRSMLIRYSDDVNSSTVLTIDDTSTRRLFAVLRFFCGARLRLIKAHDVKQAVRDAAREPLVARWARSVLKMHSGDAVEQRSLRAARSVASSLSGRPAALRHRNSTRVVGAAAPPQHVLADDRSRGEQTPPPVSAPPTVPAQSSGGHVASRRGSMDRASELKRRMQRIYEHYCPEKLPSLESAMAKYAGHEEELLAAMVLKYGPEPAATGDTAGPNHAGGGSGDRSRAATQVLPSAASAPGSLFDDTAMMEGHLDGTGVVHGTMAQQDFDNFTAQRIVLADHAAALSREIAELEAMKAVTENMMSTYPDPDAAVATVRRQADVLNRLILQICQANLLMTFRNEMVDVTERVNDARRERQARLREALLHI